MPLVVRPRQNEGSSAFLPLHEEPAGFSDIHELPGPATFQHVINQTSRRRVVPVPGLAGLQIPQHASSQLFAEFHTPLVE